MRKIILEPSTNTHTLEGDEIKTKELKNGTLLIQIKGEGLIKHGEHATIKTKAKRILKINQQEFNPVKKIIQNAVD